MVAGELLRGLLIMSVMLNRRSLLVLGLIPLVPPALADSTAPRAAGRSARGTWRSGPALPFAVQEIYPALHDGRIHVAGGFIAENGQISGATDRHVSLEPATGRWRSETPLPAARHHPNLCSFKGELLAIGGFAATGPEAGWVMQPGLWRLAGSQWLAGPALPLPNGESVAAVLEGELHVAGGRSPLGRSNARWKDHGDVAVHYRLASVTDSWEVAAPLPTARNSAAAAVIDGSWHVVGGRTVGGGNTAAHEVYDPSEDRWRRAAPMPQAQGGLAAAAMGDRLYAFGGEYFESDGGVHAEAWCYDPARDRWGALEPMPNPRHGLGAVAVNGQIYVIGGALAVGGNATSALVDLFLPES